MKIIAIITAAAMGFPIVPATADQTPCAAFTQSIEETEKAVAYLAVQNAIESRPQLVALRQGEIQAMMQEVETTILLASQNGCPAYPRPISSRTYRSSAIACMTRELDVELAGSGVNLPGSAPAPADACDRSKWVSETP